MIHVQIEDGLSYKNGQKIKYDNLEIADQASERAVLWKENVLNNASIDNVFKRIQEPRGPDGKSLVNLSHWPWALNNTGLWEDLKTRLGGYAVCNITGNETELSKSRWALNSLNCQWSSCIVGKVQSFHKEEENSTWNKAADEALIHYSL